MASRSSVSAEGATVAVGAGFGFSAAKDDMHRTTTTATAARDEIFMVGQFSTISIQ
jgi:hypothetical protein